MRLPKGHPQFKYTKTKHKMVVATGIILCGVAQYAYPDLVYFHITSGTTINLLWLLVDPEES